MILFVLHHMMARILEYIFSKLYPESLPLGKQHIHHSNLQSRFTGKHHEHNIRCHFDLWCNLGMVCN